MRAWGDVECFRCCACKCKWVRPVILKGPIPPCPHWRKHLLPVVLVRLAPAVHGTTTGMAQAHGHFVNDPLPALPINHPLRPPITLHIVGTVMPVYSGYAT